MIPSGYHRVLAVASALGLQCYLTGHWVLSPMRNRIFPQSFMKQFSQKHRESFNSEVGSKGYPDDGNGRYAQKLSYRDWFSLSNANSVHRNSADNYAPVITWLLISGLEHTNLVAGIGSIYFGLRLAYTFTENPEERIQISPAIRACNYALCAFSFKACYKLGRILK
jgi:hypothetical protein